MNEKDILASLKSECDRSAPDDFNSIVRKISKPKHSINVLFKIAAAAAIFILPVVSVYLSSHLNSIDHNTITIAEITQNTDKVTQPSSTYSVTSPVSRPTTSSSKSVLTVTEQTENSNKTVPISKAPSISSGIINGAISATPDIIPGHMSTDPAINSTASSVPLITENVPSISSQSQPASNVTEESSEPPSDMNVPSIADDKEVTTVTVTATVPTEGLPENIPIKSIRITTPSGVPETYNNYKIFKGAQYYYQVSYPEYYIVIIEYSDSSTKKVTLCEAIDEKYVSIEQLIEAGLHATITDTVK